jgi:tetratricopeptide (TPR) repeat protein
MAKIPLRVYLREIEGKIENGKIQESLSHCQQILNTFPKNIETYRLLGKAFLDDKQYENAELVFDKLLSVFPDDFVSHIGLSYIFEEKQDLAKAEEHMKKAFDVQPSNITIQDELKRLYKKNAGTELERIRLTRGALIKMYDRSNLFNQAISEINLALETSPDNYDLRAELAKIMSATGQKINAVETSIKLVSQFPYCFEANRILSESLPEVSETRKANVNKQRLIDLDPYYQFTTPEKPDVYSVPDSAVMLDHLDDLSTLQNKSDFNWNSYIQHCWETTSGQKTSVEQEKILNPNEITEPGLQGIMKMQTEESATNKMISDQPSDDKEKQSPVPLPDEKAKEHLEDQTVKQMPQDESPLPASSKPINSIPDWLLPEEEQNSESDNSQPAEVSRTDHPNAFLPDESGFVDHEVPVINNPETAKSNSQSIWIKGADQTPIREEEKKEELAESEPTQKFEESSQYYDVVLKDAHDALLSGYPQRSIDSYKILMGKNVLVDKIINQLESDLVNFPQVFPLWLILGDAYHREGLPQKALEIYQRAEGLISKGDHGQ